MIKSKTLTLVGKSIKSHGPAILKGTIEAVKTAKQNTEDKTGASNLKDNTFVQGAIGIGKASLHDAIKVSPLTRFAGSVASHAIDKMVGSDPQGLGKTVSDTVHEIVHGESRDERKRRKNKRFIVVGVSVSIVLAVATALILTFHH